MKTHNRISRLTPVTLLTSLAAFLCGCTVLTYSGANGERFCRTSLGSATAISSLTVESATNGLRRVEMHGYTNDSSQALGTVTEAAIKAAVEAAK
jgi:hypothetical protein